MSRLVYEGICAGGPMHGKPAFCGSHAMMVAAATPTGGIGQFTYVHVIFPDGRTAWLPEDFVSPDRKAFSDVWAAAIAWRKERDAAYEELAKAKQEIHAAKAELAATGNDRNDRPLDILIDAAIDRERERHHESLRKIAKAMNINQNPCTRNYEEWASDIAHAAFGIRTTAPSPTDYTIGERLVALERAVDELRNTTIRINRTNTGGVRGS